MRVVQCRKETDPTKNDYEIEPTLIPKIKLAWVWTTPKNFEVDIVREISKIIYIGWIRENPRIPNSEFALVIIFVIFIEKFQIRLEKFCIFSRNSA